MWYTKKAYTLRMMKAIKLLKNVTQCQVYKQRLHSFSLF